VGANSLILEKQRKKGIRELQSSVSEIQQRITEIKESRESLSESEIMYNLAKQKKLLEIATEESLMVTIRFIEHQTHSIVPGTRIRIMIKNEKDKILFSEALVSDSLGLVNARIPSSYLDDYLVVRVTDPAFRSTESFVSLAQAPIIWENKLERKK
jgi:hypothetical protein